MFFPLSSQDGQDSSTCAQQCECTSKLFEPVCGADDLTYFSPCRAGCMKTLGSDGVSCAYTPINFYYVIFIFYIY